MRFQTALAIFAVFFTLMPVHATAETRLNINRMLYSYNYEYAQGLLASTFVISSQSRHTSLIRAPKINLAIKAPMLSVKKIKTIYFDFNSAELTQKAKKVLDSVTQDKTISVTGYTSPTGTSAHNRKLAERRAQAAKQYLRALGVIVKDVTEKEGYYTKCDLQANRRVVIKPISQKRRMLSHETNY